MLVGKFHQFLTELSAHNMMVATGEFSFHILLFIYCFILIVTIILLFFFAENILDELLFNLIQDYDVNSLMEQS